MGLPFSRDTNFAGSSQVPSLTQNNMQDEIIALYANQFMAKLIEKPWAWSFPTGDGDVSAKHLRTIGDALAVYPTGVGLQVAVSVHNASGGTVPLQGGMLWCEDANTIWQHHESIAGGEITFTPGAAPGVGGQSRWDIIQARITKSLKVTTLTLSLKAGVAAATASAAVPAPDSGYVAIAAVAVTNGQANPTAVVDLRKPVGGGRYVVPLELANLNLWTRDTLGVLTAGASSRVVVIPLAIPHALQGMLAAGGSYSQMRLARLTINGTLSGAATVNIQARDRAGAFTALVDFSPSTFTATTQLMTPKIPNYLAGTGAVWLGNGSMRAHDKQGDTAAVPQLVITSGGAADTIKSVCVEYYGS